MGWIKITGNFTNGHPFERVFPQDDLSNIDLGGFTSDGAFLDLESLSEVDVEEPSAPIINTSVIGYE